MKPIADLNLGFSDAANYYRRKNKALFNKFFVRLPSIDRLIDPDRYFLIGDKGTGKTAFAVYLSNNNYKNNKCQLVAINETEYQSFIRLKQRENLQLSGYDAVWRVTLLLLLAQLVTETDCDTNLLERYNVFRAVRRAVDRYYEDAFSPEIITALKLVEGGESSIKLMSEILQSTIGEKFETVAETQRFQTNLRLLERGFIRALEKLKLKINITLFVDGIDIRPHGIAYQEYIDCIRGLANAMWHLNHQVFPSFRDSPGRFKVVILLRPDIFASLGLQNQNAKIQDNAVYLDWLTTYPSYRESEIFEVADRVLSVQQDNATILGEAWDNYFPFVNAEDEPSFVSFLRFSFYRPRDINKMTRLLQDGFIRSKRSVESTFRLADFNHSDFRRDYSNYLLGEVKDYLQFYYTDQDIAMFLKFFSYLNGHSSFSLRDFEQAFDRFAKQNYGSSSNRPPFLEDPSRFLQFLYELGVICYKDFTDQGAYFHMCFRERTYANMHPKVSFDAAEYIIHHGLRKGLGSGARRKTQGG